MAKGGFHGGMPGMGGGNMNQLLMQAQKMQTLVVKQMLQKMGRS